MLKLKLAIVCAAFAVFTAVQAEFPYDPRPCKYEDSACLVETINNYLHKQQGDSSIDLVSLDPLEVSEVGFKQGAGNPISIDVTLSNNVIVGLSGGEITDVKGFGKNPHGRYEIHGTFPQVSIIGDYSINGKILVLPIRGSGKGNTTMVNMQLVFTFEGVTFEKDGETYLQAINPRIILNTDRLYFHFDNLFNGIKTLGNAANLFLNQNWRQVLDGVEDSLAISLGKVYADVTNGVFQKYPYHKYLVE